ncbi:MAG: hypothetical protein HW416_844 [Chloroflexi bacterium]|nr:hypothetical protein [Chloroflexota bacterium]
MVLTDAAGTVLAANPAYCDAHECVPDDLIGKSLALIFPEAERRFAMTQYHAVFDGMATRRSSPAGVRWRDESGRVVESHIDFIAQGSHPAAMISTVRLLIAELPSSIPSDTVPDNIPERAGQHRFSRTVADLVIDAVRTWGADSIFGPPVDVTDPPGEPQRAEAARDRLDHWDDDGGASG